MKRAWGLWQARSGAYEPAELLEVFTDQETAETVRDNLFGKQRTRLVRNWVWEDDEDLPDLYVRPIEIR